MSKRSFRSDFLDELIESNTETKIFDQQIRKYNNILTNHIFLKKSDKKIGKPIGDYFSILFDTLHDKNNKENLEKIIAKNLHYLFKKYQINLDSKVLVVGMGNQNITPDALGPQTIRKLVVTNHLFINNQIEDNNNVRRVSALLPGVMGTTGMETSDIIYGVCKQYKPDILICIDALATKSYTRINRAIQISDTGISPGSGVNNHRKRIDIKSVKVPVITIGVATVVDTFSIFYEYLDLIKEKINFKLTNKKINLMERILHDNNAHLIVTPKEIDEDLKNLVFIISNALNNTFQKNNKNL